MSLVSLSELDLWSPIRPPNLRSRRCKKNRNIPVQKVKKQEFVSTEELMPDVHIPRGGRERTRIGAASSIERLKVRLLGKEN